MTLKCQMKYCLISCHSMIMYKYDIKQSTDTPVSKECREGGGGGVERGGGGSMTDIHIHILALVFTLH